jgi:hypothetical protein
LINPFAAFVMVDQEDYRVLSCALRPKVLANVMQVMRYELAQRSC